jgi:hypothetical protein
MLNEREHSMNHLTNQVASDTKHRTTDHAARARVAGDRGAIGTEMAILVAIVVAIALAVGAVMTTSAENHINDIPQTPGGDE